MKKIALAAAIILTANSAFAGALTDPIVEPAVIIEEAAAGSDHGILVPIMFLIILGVALTGGNSVT
ncbi:hypothetical protein [Aliiroseovarius sp.]|uniref:hypothetical protein n=1 Tax=Aliiroseovarius sp. TaxID=1872442 RepID=UPI002617C8F0|nr:hypothetical protein [Aliiroseovarius sp.]